MRKAIQNPFRRPVLAAPLACSGQLHAAPIEGELGSNAAALLVLLGLGALFMGLRNLRELRHKRLTPDRRGAQRHQGQLEES